MKGAPGKLVGPGLHPGLAAWPQALRKACTRSKGLDCSMSFELPLKSPDPRSQAWFRSCLGCVLPPLAFSPYIDAAPAWSWTWWPPNSPDSGPVGPELSLGVPLDAQVPAQRCPASAFLVPPLFPAPGPASTPRSPPLSPAPSSGLISWWPPNLA